MLLSKGFLGDKALYGIDIGSASVKVIQLNRKSRSEPWALERWAYLPLTNPLESNPNEKLEEASRLLKDFLAKENKGPHSAAISVSGNSVVVRYVKLPKMPKDQLSKNLPFEAEPYIPFAIPEVNIGFQILEESTEEGQQKIETVLVAAKKETINQRLEIVKSCGLKPAIVDIDAFCLQNVVPPPSESPSGHETVLVLNMGASVTTMCILEDAVCRVVRDVFIAGNTINKALQKILGFSGQEAETAKCNTHLQTETDGDDTSKAIVSVLKDLILEIQRSLDFYLSQRAERQVQRVLLSGGGARIQGIDAYLSSELHLPVEILDPLKTVSGCDVVPQDVRPHLAIATGLAMRREGDSE